MKKRKGDGLIKSHVSLVIVPIDDITNQVIEENRIKPWIEWEKAAMWKPGFYLFLNVTQTEFILHLESRHYQGQDISIFLEKGKTQIMKVRMVPSEQYPNKNAFVEISGTGKKGEIVSIYSMETLQSYKLLKEYQPGENLGIYNSDILDLSGKKIWMREREKEWFIRLGEESEKEEREYLVEGILEPVKRSEAVIYLIYETKVREDGSFYLLFPKGKQEEILAVLGYRGYEQEIHLKSEKLNQFHLEIQER